jgi:hypothetical protein
MKIQDEKTIINNFLKMATTIDTQCFANILAVEKSAVITLEFPAGAKNTRLNETGVSFANAFLEPCKHWVSL